MKVFYIFKIKKEIRNLYNSNQNALYNILKNIFINKSKENIIYKKSILEQVIDLFNKDDLDRNLFILLHKKLIYCKRENIHHINDLYKDEISRMIIKNTYIKIYTETNYSSFFEIISNFDNNLFVCDFSLDNYFFIDSIKTLV